MVDILLLVPSFFYRFSGFKIRYTASYSLSLIRTYPFIERSIVCWEGTKVESTPIRISQMSGSPTGFPLRPGHDIRVKSESNMDEYMDGQLEGTPEASVEGGSRSDPEESEESRKLRKKREVCSTCPLLTCS